MTTSNRRNEQLYVDVVGARIPKLGLGTWELQGQACQGAVRTAIDAGYRHVDTAQMYGNEADVGAALRAVGVARDQLFVTTKIAPDNLSPRRVRETARESLKRLALDYVDLMLIHWPSQEIPLSDTLGAMLELQDDGLVAHLGVSNFTPKLLEEATRHAAIVANQVEYHPYLAQNDLRSIARVTKTALTAYSPLAQGMVHDDETLVGMGRKHGKSPEQVTLRWFMQQTEVVAIPRSSSPDHIRANFDIFDFELSADDMNEISKLDKKMRLIDPSLAPEWGAQPSKDAMQWQLHKPAPGTVAETPSRHTGKSISI